MTQQLLCNKTDVHLELKFGVTCSALVQAYGQLTAGGQQTHDDACIKSQRSGPGILGSPALACH